MSKKGVNKFIQISGLLLLLVILPLVSWYYLNRGYDYQLLARSELKDYGQWQISGSGLDTMGYTFVFATLADKSLKDSNFNHTLNQLNAQFGDRLDFYIGLLDYQEEDSVLTLSEPSNFIFIDLDNFKSGQSLVSGRFYLADRKSTIRNSYDYFQVDEVKRMVEHIALILPQQPSSDIIYAPEEEK